MPSFTTWDDLLRPGSASSFFDRVPLPAFEVNLGSYSSGNAWWLAELSRLIYRHDVEEAQAPPQPTRASFLANAGLRQVAFYQSPQLGTQAFLVASERGEQFAALVFRGTEQDPRDFLTDLSSFPAQLGATDVRVHAGFEAALDAIWSSVAQDLGQLDCPIFYAGHSLGAALATLAASRRPPQAAYTFGSPRVGNDAFTTTLASVPLYRIVDHSDVVTTLPPEQLGFSHVGELHRLGARSLTRTLDNVWSWLCRPDGPHRSLADHAPINYVRRIH